MNDSLRMVQNSTILVNMPLVFASAKAEIHHIDREPCSDP